MFAARIDHINANSYDNFDVELNAVSNEEIKVQLIEALKNYNRM